MKLTKVVAFSYLSIAFLIYQNQLKATGSTIYGWITDAKTGQSIHNAVVGDSMTYQTTNSNKFGYYSLTLSSGKHKIMIAAHGYRAAEIKAQFTGYNLENIQLEPLEEGEEDPITAWLYALGNNNISHIAPTAEQIRNMPALACEPDILRFAQFLPGMMGGTEGLSGLFVRGSNADQNLLLMDNAPIYGLGHVFGVLSPFNSEQVKDVHLYRGVLPARFGGRAGGVIDVTMNEGSNSDFKGSYSINLLDFNFNFSGPMGKKTTFSAGIRRSWIDLLFPQDGENTFDYNFHDLNFKLFHKIDDNSSLTFNIYNGRDLFALKFSDSDKDSFNRLINRKFDFSTRWQNTLTSVQYQRKFSPALFANFMLGYSKFSYRSGIKFNIDITDTTGINKRESSVFAANAITDFINKNDFEYKLHNNSKLRFGSEFTVHGYKPGTEELKGTTNGVVSIDTTTGVINKGIGVESGLYAEYEYKNDRGLLINFGGRIWQFYAFEKNFIRMEPRIILRKILQKNAVIRAAFGIHNQGVNQLSSINGSLPRDVWFPAGEKIQPQQTIQGTLGLTKPLKNNFEFNAEVYYKRLKGVTDIASLDEYSNSPKFWEQLVYQGNGNAYGLEMFVIKKTGKITMMASYTYSFSDRKIEGINLDRKYFFRWDRRHSISGMCHFYLNQRTQVSLSLVIMSGNPVTVPTSKYVTADGRIVLDYSTKNNYRMPLYNRSDITVTRKMRFGSGDNGGGQYIGFNIYNWYGRFNPFSVTAVEIEQSGGKFEVKERALLRFVPTGFYCIKF